MVRVRCLRKLISQYSSVQQLWQKCLEEILIRKVRSRIVECQGQMITFDFYFGLCSKQTLYNLTDNLSKSLQSESLSAVSGHRLTLLIRYTLVNMRSDGNLQNYYHTIVKKTVELPQIEQLKIIIGQYIMWQLMLLFEKSRHVLTN